MQELDSVFDLLSQERRRYVLYYLEQQGGPVPVPEVAKTVQEWENGGTPPEFSGERDTELAITLRHRDLPKMNEAEFIEYDPGNQEIEISGTPSEVKVILAVTEAIEQPRQGDIINL